MGRRAKPPGQLDTELEHLPQDARWREWMGRVEAVIFASPRPVPREMLARVVGRDCPLELVIDDIRAELRGRPYELVTVAGGWQHRTKKTFSDAIHASGAVGLPKPDLSRHEATLLMAIAYLQPVTRGELSKILGKDISRDTIGGLRGDGLIAAGPRSPQPGAPYTYVTTPSFLGEFGFSSLRDLPDIEMLEDAGLLSKAQLLEGDFSDGLESIGAASDDETEADIEAPLEE